MDLEQKTLRVGAAAVLLALILRLLSGGWLQAAVQLLSKPETAAFLLYLETGRVVRPALTQPEETTQPPKTEPTEPAQTQPVVQSVLPAFSGQDVSLVSINNLCGCQADVPALLQQPLAWDLTGPEPTVLILHTHATESYTASGEYIQTTPYRTLDTSYNMVSVGDHLAQLLRAQGLQVLHDRTLHDGTSYNGAYEYARQTISKYLEQYPSIQLVLDIHRDAMEDSSGNQIADTVMVDGQAVARLMMVVGTDAGGLTHPQWQENLALAAKLHAQLERLCPGICRPVSFRSQRFNQDLSPGAMLVEVGAAGNTRQEALRAAGVLAEAIGDLALGTATEDSTS